MGEVTRETGAMPSEEELTALIMHEALPVCEYHEEGYPEAWVPDWRASQTARAILALFAPALAAAERRGMMRTAEIAPTIIKAGDKLERDRVSGKVVVGGYGDVPAVEFKRLAAAIRAAAGEG